MYRIAICDDDTIFLDTLSQKTEEIMSGSGMKRGIDFEIDTFCEAAQLRERFQQNKNQYQLLLLDIRLTEENGMELASSLRNDQVMCGIIYITAYREYVFDCFDTQPIWYLLKPVDYDKLKEAILCDFQRRYADVRLTLKQKNRQIAILYSDIYALESTEHHARIWLKSGYRDWNDALSRLKPMLPAWCFSQSHHSYVINLSHVTELKRTEVTMDNDQVFPVSRRYRDSIMERYFAFLKK